MAIEPLSTTRRALLGAAASLPVAAIVPKPAIANPNLSRARWTRTLAAYRRAEARVAAFKAEEALLPPERREWPAVQPLEERFGDLDSRRLTALRRLFRIPAPDLAALTVKLELALADQAWELEGCEGCLAVMAEDGRRLARADRS
ncbi:MAG TPA: hypothetical protein VEZ70_02630 [Allosphingosinicella sp.]|nr:hypothetical protein [Allosphingosinicella sp.]